MRRRIPLAVAILSALALLWLAVPGEAVKEWWNEGYGSAGGGSSLAWVEYEHGWPWVYLWRNSSGIGRWSLTHSVREFDLWALACDTGVCLLIVALAAGASLLWMRRVKSPWQFSLSSVFVGFVLVALALGWWKWMAKAADEERPLIARIEALGGTAETGFVGPVWLRKLVGMDGLPSTHRVVGVRLFLDEYDQDRLEQDGVKDQFRAMVRDIPSLSHCKEVAINVFGETRLVSDEDLVVIARAKSLESLNLAGGEITDNGLRSLASLMHLRSLRIPNTQASDEGMKSVFVLPGLKELDVSGTALTDEGLKEIGKLPKLQGLTMNRTRVTDEGLKHLAGLAELAEVEASGTGVTDRGAEQLKAAVPGISIEY